MSRRTSWLVVCAAVVVLIGATALIVFAGGGKHEKRTTSAGRRSAGRRSAGQRSAGHRSAGHRSAGHRSAGQRSAGRRSSVVTVDPRVQGRTIPAGFLGVSIEYWAIAAYAGRKPGAINPRLPRLIRALAPGQAAVLRIGGVSTDQTWWPVPGVKLPPGVFYMLNRRRLEVKRQLD